MQFSPPKVLMTTLKTKPLLTVTLISLNPRTLVIARGFNPFKTFVDEAHRQQYSAFRAQQAVILPSRTICILQEHTREAFTSTNKAETNIIRSLCAVVIHAVDVWSKF